MQPGSEVGRLADDRSLLRRALADQIADDHQPGSDPDPRVERAGFDIEASDTVDDAQPRPDRPLGIILMRSRVTEINQHPIAHILGDKPGEAADRLGDGATVGADDLPQIFGVQPRGERGRADEVAEHHRQLAAFGIGESRCIAGRRRYGGGGHF